MKKLYELKTLKEVKPGDVLVDFRGDKHVVSKNIGRAPQKESSTGRIYLRPLGKEEDSFSEREYFPTVVNCKWMDEQELADEAIKTEAVTVTLNLTRREKEVIENFRENQHPSGPGCHGTRFPVVWYVFDYDVNTVSDEDLADETIYYLGYDRFKTFDELKSKLLEYYEVSDTKDDIVKASINTLRSYDIGTDNDATLESDKCLNIYKFLNIDMFKKYVTYSKKIKAVFLSEKEALRYMEYQSHNLSSKARIYGDYTGYANNGDIEPICRIILKLGLLLNGEDQHKYDGRF